MNNWQKNLKRQFGSKALKVITNQEEYNNFMHKYNNLKSNIRDNRDTAKSIISMIKENINQVLFLQFHLYFLSFTFCYQLILF